MLLIPGIIASSKLGAVGDFESIATVTVGAGGVADVEFTSISADYQHLQIRGITRSAASQNFAGFRMRVGSGSIDTGSNYSTHQLYADGSSAAANGQANQSTMFTGSISAANDTADSFSVFVINLLDYKDTNKYLTVRTLEGVDLNGSGYIHLDSGSWRNTAAITNIRLYATAGNLAQYSHFALYGIKG